jgi:hypothetical protein
MLICNNIDWYSLYKEARNQNPLNVFASELTRIIIKDLGSMTINWMTRLNMDLIPYFTGYNLKEIKVVYELDPNHDAPFHVKGEIYSVNPNIKKFPHEMFYIILKISVTDNEFRNNKLQYSRLYIRLFESIRHELEHSLQLMSNKNSNGMNGQNNDFNLNNLPDNLNEYVNKRFEYLSRPYEVEAYVRGIMERYKKDKQEKNVYKIIDNNITVGFWGKDVDVWMQNNLQSEDTSKIHNMSNTLKDLYYKEVKRIYPFIKVKYK